MYTGDQMFCFLLVVSSNVQVIYLLVFFQADVALEAAISRLNITPPALLDGSTEGKH